MKRLFKRILSLILAFCFMLMPVSVLAEEGAVIKSASVSGYAGNRVFVNITAENLENLAALDLDIYYDKSVLSFYSAEAPGLSGASVDINTSTEGSVCLSMASTQGFSGSLTVLMIGFSIKNGTKAGDYPIYVAIGNAYDINRNPVSISGKNGKITVLEREATTPTASFYCNADKTVLEEGDETKLTYYSYSHHNMASGKFEIFYDETLFEFVDFGFYSAMQTSDAVSSVNSDNPGYVCMSCSSSTAFGTGNLFYITLRAIKDCDANTTVDMTASSLYASDLSVINGGKRSCSLSVFKKYVAPEPEDYPDIWVEVPSSVSAGNEFTAEVKIEGRSAAAAGDFTVSYNTSQLIVSSVSVHQDVTENGGSVVINPNYSNGTIKFSFVDESGISSDTALISINFKSFDRRSYSSAINVSGKAVYDADYKKVELEYKPCTVNVEKHYMGSWKTYKAATCTEEGEERRECSICDYYESRIIEAKGHKYTETVTPPTCTEKGYTTHTCSVCKDSYQDSFVDATGHKYVNSVCEKCGEELNVLYGDVDGNGKINVIDANLIRRYAAKLVSLTEEQLIAADVDGNKKVNVVDANYIRRYAAKLISTFPVEQ